MAVTVHVTSVIQKVVDGQREVEGHGGTVGEVIASVDQRYPGFAGQVLDEQGQLRRFVNVYLNDEDVRYLGGKDTPVGDGDTVSFLPALAGGAR
jgi:molybdopterin synthase sulfur carrier subunit